VLVLAVTCGSAARSVIQVRACAAHHIAVFALLTGAGRLGSKYGPRSGSPNRELIPSSLPQLSSIPPPPPPSNSLPRLFIPSAPTPRTRTHLTYPPTYLQTSLRPFVAIKILRRHNVDEKEKAGRGARCAS
jgi:hypothetical protein